MCRRMKKYIFATVPFVMLLLSTGCAVLTKSQVKEVQAFAVVAKEYGALPGDPIRVYGEAVRSDRILSVATRDFSTDKALDKA